MNSKLINVIPYLHCVALIVTGNLEYDIVSLLVRVENKGDKMKFYSNQFHLLNPHDFYQ